MVGTTYPSRHRAEDHRRPRLIIIVLLVRPAGLSAATPSRRSRRGGGPGATAKAAERPRPCARRSDGDRARGSLRLTAVMAGRIAWPAPLQ